MSLIPLSTWLDLELMLLLLWCECIWTYGYWFGYSLWLTIEFMMVLGLLLMMAGSLYSILSLLYFFISAEAEADADIDMDVLLWVSINLFGLTGYKSYSFAMLMVYWLRILIVPVPLLDWLCLILSVSNKAGDRVWLCLKWAEFW